MTDDGGQRAERNQKSEVGSRRSEDRGKKVGGWRQREDNCGLRIANCEFGSKETEEAHSSKERRRNR
jgi:hypothetical protein